MSKTIPQSVADPRADTADGEMVLRIDDEIRGLLFRQAAVNYATAGAMYLTLGVGGLVLLWLGS